MYSVGCHNVNISKYYDIQGTPTKQDVLDYEISENERVNGEFDDYVETFENLSDAQSYANKQDFLNIENIAEYCYRITGCIADVYETEE